MSWIDTHAHIYSEEFVDSENMIALAKAGGLSHILMPNVDLESIAGMHILSEKYQGFCIPMMGLHPCSVTMDYEKILREMFPLFASKKYCAVGEIGIDLYWDKSTLPEQSKAFIMQVEFAIANKLPVAIHSRNATREIIDLLKPFKSEDLRGVFHCFSETRELAEEILGLGFYLGIGGVLTFKNSGLAASIRHIPMNRILLETDSPYLAPLPYRGKRNEPAYIPLIGQKLAEVMEIHVDEVARITSENARSLFDLE